MSDEDKSVVDHKLMMAQFRLMLTSALQPVEVSSLYQDFLANGETLVEWLAAVQDMSAMLEIATRLQDDLPPERE